MNNDPVKKEIELERKQRRRNAKTHNPEWGIIWRILAISAAAPALNG